MSKSIASNFAYNFIYQILIVAVPLITTPYVSRVLGADGVGEYSYTFGIATLCSLFCSLGINLYGQREIAKTNNKDERSVLFWELTLIRIVASLFTLAVYTYIMFSSNDYKVSLLGQMFILLAAMVDVSWYFQGDENFRIITIRNTLVKIVAMVAIFLFVKSRDDTLLYIVICSGSLFLGNFALLCSLRHQITRCGICRLRPGRHLKEVLQYFVPIIAVQLYTQVDKVMLGALLDDAAQNGYFEQSRKITNLVITLCTSINTVMFPRIARLASDGDNMGVRGAYGSTLRLIWMLLLPFTVGVLVAADSLSAWFYGPGYDAVPLLLRLSTVSTIFAVLGNFIGMQFLNPLGKQNLATMAYVAAACVNVAVNLCLIPSLGAVGAVVGSCMAELTSFAIQYALFWKSSYRVRITSGCIRYLLASLVMGAVIIAIELSPLYGFVLSFTQLIVGGVVYFAFLAMMRDSLVVDVLSRVTRLMRRSGSE